jgi:hypothetical protein
MSAIRVPAKPFPVAFLVRFIVTSATFLAGAWQQTALAEDDAAALARLRKEIAAAVGEPACGNVAFCRVAPSGHDACGNPSLWIVFNNAPGVREIVETKASEITFIEEEMHRGRPRPADCRPAAKPRLACVNGRCVLGDTSY